MKTGVWKRISDFWTNLDPTSKPAFFMFLVVMAAAGGLNYIGLLPVVGQFISVSIALFFGVGVLSWHVTEARTDDSEEQEDVAQVVKWLNVILDGCLIVINLFRADLRSTQIIDGMTTWDTLAFVMIGTSAASHVVGYLLWNQYDVKRQNAKELKRSLTALDHKSERSNIAIRETEAHMMKIKWIETEAQRLRVEYSGVPGIDVEKMIREMRTKALAEFNKKEQAQPTQNQEKRQPVSVPAQVNAAETTKPELQDKNP